ncbi:MAG: helix-turn-helix domain-containing protein [Phycisphaerales bacterium]|nr:helix-turn-helix domain-containing protein [Phycisphaerales bacterium]
MPEAATEKLAKPEAERILCETFAQVFRAYAEASDSVQAMIREMCEVINDPETTPDECESAYSTLIEALFPISHKGELGIDIEELREVGCKELDDFKPSIESHDKQEQIFAERLKDIMESNGITQSDLAEKISVQQPAISMMLNRKCRPQKRTIEKIATALNVSPEELWPTS